MALVHLLDLVRKDGIVLMVAPLPILQMAFMGVLVTQVIIAHQELQHLSSVLQVPLTQLVVVATFQTVSLALEECIVPRMG